MKILKELLTKPQLPSYIKSEVIANATADKTQIRISITVTELQEKDLLILEEVFVALVEQGSFSKSRIEVMLHQFQPAGADYFLDNLNDIETILSKQEQVFVYPILFKALCIVFNKFEADLDRLCGRMQENIPALFKRVSYEKQNMIYLSIDHLIDCNGRFGGKVFLSFIEGAIVHDRVEQLLPWLESKRYLATLEKRKFSVFNSLMIFAARTNNSSFHLLLTLCKEMDFTLFDNKGNSILHLVTHPSAFEDALRLVKYEIDSLNCLGETALHISARENNLKKARFLLFHGADKEMLNHEKETFLTLPIIQKNNNRMYSLDLYRSFVRKGGIVLFPLPLIDIQQGYNCGFYAVACAANYHFSVYPHQFNAPPLSARKRDMAPKGVYSLRQLRHSLNIPGIGSIFSTEKLQEVIAKTQCQSIAYTIKDEKQFNFIILNAIKLNLPVIIPFALNLIKDPSQEPLASQAHWATIIGFYNFDVLEEATILITQFGEYYEVPFSTLYKAFFDIPEKISKLHFVKQNSEWEEIDTLPLNSQYKKQYTIEEQSLDNFRRKLIAVLPPSFVMPYDLEAKYKDAHSNKKTLFA